MSKCSFLLCLFFFAHRLVPLPPVLLPPGAKDKKPRTKPKTVAVVEEPEYVEPEQVEEEEPQLPRVLPGSRPIPTEADARDHTARIMLAMLQQQAQDRQRRKTDLWKSWFR